MLSLSRHHSGSQGYEAAPAHTSEPALDCRFATGYTQDQILSDPSAFAQYLLY